MKFFFLRKGMFPIRGIQIGLEDYKQRDKKTDQNKQIYYKCLVAYINDLKSYNRMTQVKNDTPLDYITLESYEMTSAKLFVSETGARIQNIDIISKNVQFTKTKKSVKTGDLFTGELFDYLDDVRPRVYDVVNFDFCGTWTKQKGCVKKMFQLRLFDECAFLAITCCARNNAKSEHLYQNQDEAECRNDVRKWAWANGYAAEAHHEEFHYNSMFCLFFKVIHLENTMSYQGGIDCKITAHKWLHTSVDIPKREPRLSIKPNVVGKRVIKRNRNRN